ncbi:hypothetical protein SLS55_002522 [Diplodia seriata]|uniref:Adenosine deaminase domain-containing protein n=1 Tax=Diplodia seriata TaxID=420778 RepID=A0ABR3CV04_9PEZI
MPEYFQFDCNNYSPARYSTLSVLESFRQDNVVHLELRTTPRAIPDQGITKTQYVETILACIEEHNARPLNTMHTGLILSVDRRNSLVEAEEVIGLALSFQSRGVIGIDLCGDPMKGDVRIFSGVFAKAKAAGMKITVHFAEAAASSTDTELWTLLNWYPDRIGHVIHVKEEIRKRIVEQKIGTDDVGVFCSPLSEEYYLAITHFNLSREDVKELCEGVVDIIFASDEEKSRLRKLYASWDGWK